MRFPEGRFATPRDALTEAFTTLARLGPDAWITVTVTGHSGRSGEELIVEGKVRQLNTLQDELPEGLVARIGARRVETALYDIPGADAAAMALAIDTIIREHYGAPDRYSFEAQIEE